MYEILVELLTMMGMTLGMGFMYVLDEMTTFFSMVTINIGPLSFTIRYT